MCGIKLTRGRRIPKSVDFSQVYGRCLKHCLLTSVTVDVGKQQEGGEDVESQLLFCKRVHFSFIHKL